MRRRDQARDHDACPLEAKVPSFVGLPMDSSPAMPRSPRIGISPCWPTIYDHGLGRATAQVGCASEAPADRIAQVANRMSQSAPGGGIRVFIGTDGTTFYVQLPRNEYVVTSRARVAERLRARTKQRRSLSLVRGR